MATEKWEKLAARLEGVLDHVDNLLERVAPAPRWALYSGGRSGRSARQFIDDQLGRLELA